MGGVSNYSFVINDGELVKAYADWTVCTLAGTSGAVVDLGTHVLTVGNGVGSGVASTYAGVITGAGSLVIINGIGLTLAGVNTYTGSTTISSGTLALSGTGSIASSSNVLNNGTFDISGTSAGASITSLSGSGNVLLGNQTLTLTNASSTFSGVISGSGGLTIAGGTETLTNVNTYTGDTIIDSGARLNLASPSRIGLGNVVASGVLDMSGASGGVSIASLAGSGSVDIGGNSATLTSSGGLFNGSLSGSGTITTQGSGSLILNGNSSAFTGTTEIASGLLEVGDINTPAAVLGGDVMVDAAGTLRGHGSISGNVMNNGTVEPGGSIGTLSVIGNYAQGADATLLIDVASGATTTGNIGADSGYGRLVVAGDTTIAQGSHVTLQSSGYAFAVGQRYVVIDTAGTAIYNAGALTYSMNGTAGTVSGSVIANGGNSDLVLTVDSVGSSSGGSGSDSGSGSGSGSGSDAGSGSGSGSGSGGATGGPALPATVPNAVSSLRGLLHYTGIANAQLLVLYNASLGAMSSGSAADANRIGQQLTPLQSARATAAPTFDALSIVNAHVNALRLAQADGATGLATGDSFSQVNLWGQAFGGHASQDARDNVDGYSANYGGLLIGADKAINDKWRIGGVFQYAHTAINNSDNTSGDSTGVNGYGLIGYASFTGSPWYVNLSGAAVLQSYDTERRVTMDGFDGLASGSFNGQQYVASIEGGWPLALGSATLTPLASLAYSYLNQNSYTETGGNGAALHVDSTSASSVRSALGAKIEKAFDTSYGQLVPELRVAWVHEYNRTRQSTGASFAGDPTGQTGFTTVGMTPVSNLADISLGLTLLRANNLSVTARYELQAGSGFISNTGIVRLQQRF